MIEATKTLSDDDKVLSVNSDEISAEDRYYLASQWQLMWQKFRSHRLAMFGLSVLGVMYFVAIFSGFFTVNDVNDFRSDYIFVKPQAFHFVDAQGSFHFRPFVYGYELHEDPITWRKSYVPSQDVMYPIRLFVEGHTYKLFGLFETNIHLFGVDAPGVWFPFGTDDLGRCLFSRTIEASKVSLFIGIFGVLLSFVIGCIMGGLSGYLGGRIDMAIQRVIEFVLSIPTIPLWMALAAALPSHWSSIQVFFGITIVLSAVGWANLARVVRGKTMELREADFVLAARLMGMPTIQIVTKHLLPSFMSYLIVSVSLGIPSMIIAEAALSFLQIGIKPPSLSWGVLLQGAQNIRALSESPWLLIPGAFIIVAVLCYNFVGDGLRDAADPYR